MTQLQETEHQFRILIANKTAHNPTTMDVVELAHSNGYDC